VDQDIMNVLFLGKVLLLPHCWDVAVWALQPLTSQQLRAMTKRGLGIFLQYLKTLKKIKIVHYAGNDKPIAKPKLHFAALWWYYARQTNFFLKVISSRFKKLAQPALAEISSFIHLYGSLFLTLGRLLMAQNPSQKHFYQKKISLLRHLIKTQLWRW
jgi:lipopolysaccharide biosynthesis glycosyltransferase